MGSTLSFITNFFTGLGLDQTISEGIAASIIFVSIMVGTWIGHKIFERYFMRWAKKTETTFDEEILGSIKTPILVLAVIFGANYALGALSVYAPYQDPTSGILLIIGIFVVAFIITKVTKLVVNWYGEQRAKRNQAVSNHILFVLNKIVQGLVYVAAFIAILFAFNVNLSGVVVGLGVGGIAIALAVQTVLSDILSAFSIYFDRPFEIGDFIVVGDNAGTVTKIGMKSTRVQLLQGEELIISNRELTNTQVRNFKKLKKRRVVKSIGVSYETPVEKLKKIPQMISDIICKIHLADFDRAHFREFGDFSLLFEVVYYVKTGDYVKYMDIQQQINLGIKEAFEKEDIEIAFPTQTIFVRGNPAPAS